MRSLAVIGVVVLGVSGGLAIRHVLPNREAQAAVGVVPAQQIQSIAIDRAGELRDHRGLPLAVLHALLETKPGDMIDDAKLARDCEAIETELAGRGYVSARVAPAAVTFAPQGGAYVVFDVDPGPMFHVRSVSITGPGRSAAEVVTLTAGDEAVRDRLARARQSLADTLERRGGGGVVLSLRNDFAAAAVDVELVTQ